MKAAGNVTIRNLGCGTLDLGGGGSTVPEGPVPDGATNRFLVTGCGDNCTLAPSPAATRHRLHGDRLPFGPPLPITNGALGRARQLVAPNAGGLPNTATGVMSRQRAAVGACDRVETQPCPRCCRLARRAGDGHADRARGQTCLTTNSAGLSADCVPGRHRRQLRPG
jgi:hypothetical protein